MIEGRTYFVVDGEHATRIDWHSDSAITESGRLWVTPNKEPGKELEPLIIEGNGKRLVLEPHFYNQWIFWENHPMMKMELDLDRSPYDVNLPITAPSHLRLKYWRRKEVEYYVHELVAKYFIPNPEGYEFVEHIDQNRFNNHFTNLRWTPLDPKKQDLYLGYCQGYYYKAIPQHLVDIAEAHYNSDKPLKLDLS